MYKVCSRLLRDPRALGFGQSRAFYLPGHLETVVLFLSSVPLTMPSFVVAGASRGLGVRCLTSFSLNHTDPFTKLEFIKQLSKDSSNVVVGLVRKKDETLQRLGHVAPKNLFILEADITDAPALKVSPAGYIEIEDVHKKLT